MNVDKSVWQKMILITEVVPGWSPPEELFSLYHLVLSTSNIDGNILEIGSWCGRSSIAMAMACSHAGNGKVIACDLFPNSDDWWRNSDGTYSFSVEIDGRKLGAYQDQTVWPEPYEKDIIPLYRKNKILLNLFKSYTKEFGLSNFIEPIRGDSDYMVGKVSSKSKFRLAFIDGDHSYHSVCKDIRNIEPLLLPGSWIAFDDAFTSYDGVDQAITDLIIKNNKYESHVQLTKKMYAAKVK